MKAVVVAWLEIKFPNIRRGSREDRKLYVKLRAACVGVWTPKLLTTKQKCQRLKRDI